MDHRKGNHKEGLINRVAQESSALTPIDLHKRSMHSRNSSQDSRPSLRSVSNIRKVIYT